MILMLYVKVIETLKNAKKEGLFTYLDFLFEIRKQIFISIPIKSCSVKFKREKRIYFNSGNNALINLVKICIDYNKKSRIIREIEIYEKLEQNKDLDKKGKN